jgi:hypothetical protein
VLRENKKMTEEKQNSGGERKRILFITPDGDVARKVLHDDRYLVGVPMTHCEQIMRDEELAAIVEAETSLSEFFYANSALRKNGYIDIEEGLRAGLYGDRNKDVPVLFTTERSEVDGLLERAEGYLQEIGE